MSVANTHNLHTIYGIVTIGSLGVGAVIIPCSIIAQLTAPPELIGTITAITLSIRYIGGAIGFSAYYNIFYHKLSGDYAVKIAGYGLAEKGMCYDLPTITELVTLAANAEFTQLKALIASSPKVNAGFHGEKGYDLLIGLMQQSFSLAYRWPCEYLTFWLVKPWVALGSSC